MLNNKYKVFKELVEHDSSVLVKNEFKLFLKYVLRNYTPFFMAAFQHASIPLVLVLYYSLNSLASAALNHRDLTL